MIRPSLIDLTASRVEHNTHVIALTEEFNLKTFSDNIGMSSLYPTCKVYKTIVGLSTCFSPEDYVYLKMVSAWIV